ncbi:QWRF motif-containing protein 3 [Morus notabilis]|uniref:QWRF motif-containing protein 3 n=1 Tax=Morus notabilis TaxID=981085 RepID=UPI000CED163E|nr:QWRF motif-containing protein 3 [Morus notabilis]
MKKNKESELPVVLDQSMKPRSRKPKYREVSSRYISPSSSPTNSIDIGNPPPIQALSPVRRKPDSRKNRPGQLDDPASLRGLWPSSSLSSSASKFDTLADHLGNDRLNDLLERKSSVSLDIQGSSRESINRNENDKDFTGTKENHRPIIGGSMRYTGTSRFSGKSSSLSFASKVFNSSEMAPGRLSVDENSLFQKPRRMSEIFTGNAESGSELSDAVSSTYSRVKNKSGIEVSSKYMNDIGRQQRRGTSDSNLSDNSPRFGNFTFQKAIKRANSLTGYGSSKSQWALSPGRSDSPPLSVENKGKPMSFSSLRPPDSSSKTKGVEKFASESVHQLRMLHGRLIDWRFANAKADSVNANLANHAEGKLICAWDGLTKLQHSVVQKKLQLQREKLEIKLNSVLQSQFKLLEVWGDMGRQHLAAVSMTKESLHSVICKAPLVEGAKIDVQSASVALRHALDFMSSIKSMLTTFSPLTEETVSLISELAEVVVREKLLLEECIELLKTIFNLEVEERSLRCSILQMKSLQQQKHKVDEKDKKSVHDL